MKIVLLYIDPGSGSYLVQMIIAAVLGSLFFFKNLWLKFKSFFVRSKKEDVPQASPPAQATEGTSGFLAEGRQVKPPSNDDEHA